MADCIVRWNAGTAESFDTKLDRELADAVLEGNTGIERRWKYMFEAVSLDIKKEHFGRLKCFLFYLGSCKEKYRKQFH